MRVITRKPLAAFWAVHPEAEAPLLHWFRQTQKAVWHRFPDVRDTFRHADLVAVGSGERVVVFNVGSNNCRVVAKISFEKQKVYVLRVLTHREYDRQRWKDEL
jgi:mRNA interferase HigB